MKRVSAFSIFLFVILILRFTGFFSFWLKEGVAEVSPVIEAPAFPSFSLTRVRDDLPVTTKTMDMMRQERGREEYRSRQQLPGAIKKYLHVFTTSGRVDFSNGCKIAGHYSDVLGPVLDTYGLPPEMLFLAYIESGFKLDARSRTNAVGPWQFMEATARRYGLRVDEHVDERVDFLKSTHAAGRYLRDLCREFDSLELALAAYNTGENRVRSAITRGGTTDFWTLASEGYFSRQTVNHVAKFSAAMLLTAEPQSGISYRPI
jgi:hypothetical protein